MIKRLFPLIIFVPLLPILIAAQVSETPREQWLFYLDKVARPVMSNIAADKLKTQMPVVLSEMCDNPEQRKPAAYLEAFARTLCGLAPWLNGDGGSVKEIALRRQYRKWALQGIANAVDPGKIDYLLWSGYQSLVDASFFILDRSRYTLDGKKSLGRPGCTG